MKLTEQTLPLYPTAGSIERKQLIEIILNTKKQITTENRKNIQAYIDMNEMKKIPYDMMKEEGLIEVINEKALAAIKRRPSVYFIEPKGSDGVYEPQNIYPIYPEKSSEYFKEVELLKKEWDNDKEKREIMAKKRAIMEMERDMMYESQRKRMLRDARIGRGGRWGSY
jgi:hypothetical protein